MYFMIILHEQELEKANSQNVEQRHQNKFYQVQKICKNYLNYLIIIN